MATGAGLPPEADRGAPLDGNGVWQYLAEGALRASHVGPVGLEPVPLENRIRLLACGFVMASGGLAVFVDQPVQYGFSADS